MKRDLKQAADGSGGRNAASVALPALTLVTGAWRMTLLVVTSSLTNIQLIRFEL
jgi:hypothetical protein